VAAEELVDSDSGQLFAGRAEDERGVRHHLPVRGIRLPVSAFIGEVAINDEGERQPGNVQLAHLLVYVAIDRGADSRINFRSVDGRRFEDGEGHLANDRHQACGNDHGHHRRPRDWTCVRRTRWICCQQTRGSRQD
jgi:hypothetical protein